MKRHSFKNISPRWRRQRRHHGSRRAINKFLGLFLSRLVRLPASTQTHSPAHWLWLFLFFVFWDQSFSPDFTWRNATTPMPHWTRLCVAWPSISYLHGPNWVACLLQRNANLSELACWLWQIESWELIPLGFSPLCLQHSPCLVACAEANIMKKCIRNLETCKLNKSSWRCLYKRMHFLQSKNIFPGSSHMHYVTFNISLYNCYLLK
jgi:hypothetical protein